MIVGWYPDLQAGTKTGDPQAAYKVDVTDKYVLMGGRVHRADSRSSRGSCAIPDVRASHAPEGKAETLGAKAEVTTSGSVKVSFTCLGPGPT